ncbi:MAG: DUF4349 domain-containing protein [Treponema sp.]|nr:DUF4349 domain-containing protein [Treponema sp.]
MNKLNYKKIFAVAFTVISVGAVIAANNKKPDFLQTKVFKEKAMAPRLAMARHVSSDSYFENAQTEAFAEDIMEEDFENADSAQIQSEKKKIKNTDVNLQVKNLSETFTAIESWVKKYGGYISSSNENSTSINITAHIPADDFDKAMESTGTLGKIKNKNINERDVTEQYYDVKTRLENKRILIAKFQDYLTKAKNIQEILQVESQLSNATSEFENLQGQLNRLSKEVAFSKVNLYAQLPESKTESGIILPDTKSEFYGFITNIVNFIMHYLWSILYIVICGTLFAMLFIFVYWICFGKIGLLRKIFNKIK